MHRLNFSFHVPTAVILLPLALGAATIRVPQDQQTIQAGVTASHNGDTVLVDDGNYQENVNLGGRTIVLASRYLKDGDEDHIAATVIDGSAGNNRSTISIKLGERPTIIGFTLTGALTDYGGGVYCRASSPKLSYLVITGCRATRGGAGVYATLGSNITLDHVTITNDSAGYIAGGFGVYGNSTAALTNCLITDNYADHVGGGLYAGSSVLDVRAVTVVKNVARHNGGGLYVTQSATVNVNDCIFRDDVPNELYEAPLGQPASSLTVRFSDVEGGESHVLVWTPATLDWWSNIDEDPSFTDAESGDYMLQDGSPCIDAGNPESPDDPDGTRADIGRYYYANEDGQKVLRVPSDYNTIQNAIDAASEGDIVFVRPGTFHETVTLDQRRNLLICGKRYTTGNEAFIDSTVIAGNGDGSVAEITSSDGIQLDGLTIIGGAANYGGGVYLDNSTATLRCLILHGNEALTAGGGLANVGGNLQVLNCRINGNTAQAGGGIYCESEGTALFFQCLLSANEADYGGGAVVFGQDVSIVNCTITDNVADREAGGIRLTQAANVELNNSILWNNTGPNGDLEILFDPNGDRVQCSSYYSLIAGGQDGVMDVNDNGDLTWGDGNIDGNPAFADAANGDYHLTENSPCINVGDPDSPNDPDGTRADIGAYYFDNPIQRDPMTIHVPGDFATIQGAIDNSIDRDTILVAPGRYTENINYNGKNVLVASEYILDGDPAYIDSTIIDGGGAGPVVTLSRREGGGAQLVGFQITGGADSEGGGIYLMESSPNIERCVIYDNTAVLGGGAIFCYNGRPTIRNCTICANSCSDDGGALFIWSDAAPDLNSCILWGNEPAQVCFGAAPRDRSVAGFSYCDVQDGLIGIVRNDNGDVNWGNGNMNSDPLFADYDVRDLHIDQESPCVDRGDPDLPLEFDGSRRDVGALIFIQEIPLLAFSPEELEFGDVAALDSVVQSVSIVSAGSGDLEIDNVTFTGDERFQVVDLQGLYDRLPVVLPVGDSLQVNIQIYSEEFGEVTGWMHIESNDAGSPDSVRFHATVSDMAPVVAEEIPDLSVDEDPGLMVIADLDTVFTDPDGDPMTFIVDGADELGLSIDADNVLSLNSAENFNGANLEVIITADDGHGRLRVRAGGLRADPRSLRQTLESPTPSRSLRSVRNGLATRNNLGAAAVINPQFKIQNPKSSLRSLRSVFSQGASPRRDASVSDAFLVTINPVNDPPVIVDAAGNEVGPQINVALKETEDLSLTFIARDAEDAARDLHWILAERDGLPDGYHFADNRNGTATFTWTPTYDDARPVPYTPLFFVIDTGDSMDVLRVGITVGNINRRPEVAQRIADYTINEDPIPRRRNIVDLDDVFNDPDHGEDAELRFSFSGAPALLHLQMNGENVLNINPEQNFNTPNPVPIIVSAKDPHDSVATDTFTVMVTPVNDPPTGLALYSPSDSTLVEQGRWSVKFDWSDATDVDGDQLRYNLYLHLHFGNRDTMVTRGAFLVTEFTINRMDSVLMAAGILAGDADRRTTVKWWVTVTDGDTTLESPTRRTLIVAVPSTVSERNRAMPEDFVLQPVFPNPFNAVARLEFGLPHQSHYSLEVWDNSGREVARLGSGILPAGWHETIWRAEGLPTGTYLFVLQAGDRRLISRGVLLR